MLNTWNMTCWISWRTDVPQLVLRPGIWVSFTYLHVQQPRGHLLPGLLPRVGGADAGHYVSCESGKGLSGKGRGGKRSSCEIQQYEY